MTELIGVLVFGTLAVVCVGVIMCYLAGAFDD